MFTEDLSVFFQTGDFATAALYKAGGAGPGVTKNVIFDAAFIAQFGIDSTNPVALAMASDFSGFRNNDTLTINGVAYRITQSQPQDDGAIVLLQLEKP